MAAAQAGPAPGGLSALRDPAEQLLREQQERERAQILRPDVVQPAPAQDDRFAPFPAELSTEGGPSFAIERITLALDAQSAVLIDSDEFHRIASLFEGHVLGVAHINALLDRLTRSLVASGYITSRATVADQSIAGGQLVIRIQAGRIEQIRYNGQAIPTRGFEQIGLRMALPMEEGDVLRLQDIEQAVDQINRLRRNSVQVQIKPGEQAGGSVVEFSNKPGDARSYSLSTDNQGSSGTGRMRIQAGVEQGNALGLMESMSLGLVTSTETNAVFGSFSVPLGYYTLTVMRSWSEYQNLIGDTALVYGSSQNSSIALNRLLSRSQDSKTALDLSLTRRHSVRAINNLSLTPQTQAVARVGLNRLSRFTTPEGMGQWTFDVGVVRGLSGLGADRDPADLPDAAAHAQFTKLEATTTLQLPLSKRWAWRSRMAAQWSRTPLYSSEQLFAGGVSSVRGFSESAAGGDRGVSMRNEWIVQGVPSPFGDTLFGKRVGIEPYLFVDGAVLRTVADAHHYNLLSAGAGVRFSIGAGSGEIILGKPLKAPDSVADRGARINLQFGWQF